VHNDSFYNAEFELTKWTVLMMVVLAATETCWNTILFDKNLLKPLYRANFWETC
jgi:hypothetical protein